MAGLRVAVQGCGHGELDIIYEKANEYASKRGWDGLDVVIICGDFQATRNHTDLNVMACPVKYRRMLDFHSYYSGEKRAPYLTLFIGGNHEASNHLSELPYGGWVAPNIYYLGAANVLRVGPLRIAGLSGIFHPFDYKKTHYERLPYSPDEVRSVYHTREIDERKLRQIRTQVDVGLSHDWPRGSEYYGDSQLLFRIKPFLKTDADSGRLNSPAARAALDHLRPPYWFSAHHHFMHAGILRFGEGAPATAPEGAKRPPSEISLRNGKDSSKKPRLIDPGAADENEIDLDMSDDAAEKEERPRNEVETLDVEASRNNVAADPKPIVENDTAQDEPAVEETTNGKHTKRDNLKEPWADVYFHDNGKVFSSQAKKGYSGISAETLSKLPDSFKESMAKDEAPNDIKNEVTRFLALGKYERPEDTHHKHKNLPPRENFLRVFEIKPHNGEPVTRPVKLSYDAEWLAITRVFADGIVGASKDDKPPADKGKGVYQQEIKESEAWVDEHIVKSGKLDVPENFQVVAPTYSGPEHELVMPREYGNPQTQQYCDLLEINNPVAVSEEEAIERHASMPRLSVPERGPGDRGRGGRGRGREGRGGFRGGRGRGFRGGH